MGVHDFVCSVCGSPTSWDCREGTGEPCGPDGFGTDRAHVDLYFFEQPPADVHAFAASRSKAVKVLRRTYVYDWGAWEFEPPLNYWDVAMDGDESRGAWPVLPTSDERHAAQLTIPDGQSVWAEVTCIDCHERFVLGQPGHAPCLAYLEAVGAQLGLPFDRNALDAKGRFVEEVRARLAARRMPA